MASGAVTTMAGNGSGEFRRIETAPGDEMEVGFGQGAPVIDAAGS